MDIQKTSRDRIFFIIIDGKELCLRDAARVLGVSEDVLGRGCKKTRQDEFAAWLCDMQWRFTHGLSCVERIICVDGERTSTSLVMRSVGVSRPAAWARIKGWRAGRFSYKQMMRPKSRRRKAVVQKTGAESDNRGEGSWQVTGLGPRKKIEDVPLGSWELGAGAAEG